MGRDEPRGPELTSADVDLADLRPRQAGGWERYVLGVAWALHEAGADVPGADILVDSDVPLGAGLSSSASLVVAVTVAVAEARTVFVRCPERVLSVRAPSQRGPQWRGCRRP